ncbi:UNVERIFIED_CONTAM: hypothetical protein K2H54_055962 [Gekko kuhli]
MIFSDGPYWMESFSKGGQWNNWTLTASPESLVEQFHFTYTYGLDSMCPCLGVDKSIQTDSSLLFGVDLKGDSGRVDGALFAKQCLLVGETLQFLISLVRRVESKIAELGEQIKLAGHDTNNSSHKRSRINSVHGLSAEEPSIRKSNCKFSTILQQHQATLIIHPWRGQLMDWRSKRSAECFLSQILDIPHKTVDLEYTQLVSQSEDHMKVTLTFASKYIPQLLFNNSARLKFFRIRSQRVFRQVAARSFQDLSMKSQMKESVQGKRKETLEVGKAGSSLLNTRNAEDSKNAEKPSSLGQEAILQNIKYMHDVLTSVQILDERLNVCNQGIHPQGHGPANLSSIASEALHDTEANPGVPISHKSVCTAMVHHSRGGPPLIMESDMREQQIGGNTPQETALQQSLSFIDEAERRFCHLQNPTLPPVNGCILCDPGAEEIATLPSQPTFISDIVERTGAKSKTD